MKYLLPVIFIIAFTRGIVAQDFNDFETKSNSFFNKYVSGDVVNYLAIKSSLSELASLMKRIETMNLSTANDNQKKAFYINSYNLLVINQIIKNYPTKSVMDITGFFESNTFKVAGEKTTLNDLENKKLRGVYNDPRFHFVLVCGAVSCPPIINESYQAKTIDAQLERQTKNAINNPKFIQVNNGKVKISEIFNWYKTDFTQNGKSVNDFINKYVNTKISPDLKPSFYSYDWNLNESKNNKGEMLIPNLPSGGVNLQTYNPGSLLKKGQMDITLFNSIYTENENDWIGQVYGGYRTTFATALLQYSYGLTKSARFNVGLDISFRGFGKSTTNDDYGNISRAFDFENNDTTRVGVAYIAPKIKFQPFEDVDEFTLQSSFQIVLPKHSEGYTNPDGSGNGNLFWIEWDRYVWWTQLFYSKTFLNDKFQVFGEVDLLFRFRKTKAQVTNYDIPLSLFLSWFHTKKLAVYGMFQHVPRFIYDTKNPRLNDWVIAANYTQLGAGMKYQIAKSINLELLYTNFFRGVNSGLGETYNLGIKYILN